MRLHPSSAWSGQTHFGDGWAWFEGRCGDARPHRHLAAQLIVGLSDTVEVTGEVEALAGPAVLVRAGALHAVSSTTSPARVVYVQSFSPLGRAWAATSGGRDLVLPARPVVDALRRAPDPAVVLSALARAAPAIPLDARLSHALEGLMSATPGVAGLIAAARDAGLSAARLRALAAQQLGAPLSHWRLWFMLERALRALGQGARLADAAADAGFSDQAHLSRTMRRFFGVTPGMAEGILRPRAG